MITRRAFVRDGTAALVGLGVVPSFAGVARRTRPGMLVVVLQSGGADALNMVVPFRDPDYYCRRPTIAIPPPGRGRDVAIDLDGTFAFHPRMAPLMPWYRAGRLAVVHACGLPDGPSTHLEAGEYLHTGVRHGNARTDGWLARWLSQPDPTRLATVRALSASRGVPRCLDGAAAATTVIGWQVESADLPRELPERTGYPATSFGHAMRSVARLVRGRQGFEAAVVESGGWDTHTHQGGATGALADRLDDLAHGIAAFLEDLGDRAAEVTLVTLSEFGRSISENRYGGTDHGRGGVVLAVGERVAGGVVHGRWPGLAPAKPGDGGLAVTTDVRSILAHLPASHLTPTDRRRLFPDCPESDSARAVFPGVRGSPPGRCEA